MIIWYDLTCYDLMIVYGMKLIQFQVFCQGAFAHRLLKKIENWVDTVFCHSLPDDPWCFFSLMALMRHWLRKRAFAFPRVGVWASHFGFVLRSPAGWSCRQRVPWRHLLPYKLTCVALLTLQKPKVQEQLIVWKTFPTTSSHLRCSSTVQGAILMAMCAAMEFNSSSEEEEAGAIEGMFNQLQKIANRNDDDDSWSKSKWWGKKSVLQRL